MARSASQLVQDALEDLVSEYDSRGEQVEELQSTIDGLKDELYDLKQELRVARDRVDELEHEMDGMVPDDSNCN